jgi:hypothetical protein
MSNVPADPAWPAQFLAVRPTRSKVLHAVDNLYGEVECGAVQLDHSTPLRFDGRRCQRCSARIARWHEYRQRLGQDDVAGPLHGPFGPSPWLKYAEPATTVRSVMRRSHHAIRTITVRLAASNWIAIHGLPEEWPTADATGG